jgi:iron(III) transport system ATP-binding protein
LLTVSGIYLHEHGSPVLQNISFAQPAGRKLALTGESGAGKSTLLQIVAGLIQPSAGEVRVAGSRVRGPAETLVPGHPGVAYLSQKSELPHSLRVEQVLRYANKRPEAEAQQLYELCRIEHLLSRRTDQLSGGEQQRVALARLLLGSPHLLLLDEPFSNLDRSHKRALQAILEDIGARLSVTCLLVSHDAADTLPWADEIMVLRRGQLVQQGTPEQIYQQPVDEYTAALFGDYNLIDGPDRRALLPAGTRLPKNTALLIRPEQLVVSASPLDRSVRGVVIAIRYFGEYHELEFSLRETVVKARVNQVAVAPGDKVYLAISPGAGWTVRK